MPTTDWDLANLYFSLCPQTFRELQKTVLAAADASASLHKNWNIRQGQTRAEIQKTQSQNSRSLRRDRYNGHLMAFDPPGPTSTDQNYLRYINDLITRFSQAFPNWPDAYEYWQAFYKRASAQGITRY